MSQNSRQNPKEKSDTRCYVASRTTDDGQLASIEMEVLVSMQIKYVEAPDVKKLADEIVDKLGLFHVVPQFVFCFRSTGSTSRCIIARIHGLGKIWQEALNLPPSYTIEVISERFDKLSQREKEKTIIHELLHVPEAFAGGFRPHKGYINDQIVERLHRTFEEKRRGRGADC